jgi:hypothetical protein
MEIINIMNKNNYEWSDIEDMLVQMKEQWLCDKDHNNQKFKDLYFGDFTVKDDNLSLHRIWKGHCEAIGRYFQCKIIEYVQKENNTYAAVVDTTHDIFVEMEKELKCIIELELLDECNIQYYFELKQED